jgi:hypothetical protein
VGDDPTAAAGLLNIRVWTEDGQFRARIRLTTDLARPHEGVTVVTSPEQVETIVATWLGMLTPVARGAARSSGK